MELPVFVAVTAEPVAAVVMPLIRKAHRDAIIATTPDFLDQAVVELALPFTPEERFDGRSALQKLGAISPAAVGSVSERDARRISCIPGVLRHTRLLGSSFKRERRQWGAVHGFCPSC